jgi:hypothetical protein
VSPGEVGPNGFKIGYNEDGDKVEWIEEDGEIWPMVLRRNDNHILEEYSELQDRVWYVGKLIMFENFESGKEKRRPESEPFIKTAIEKMKRMEEPDPDPPLLPAIFIFSCRSGGADVFELVQV